VAGAGSESAEVARNEKGGEKSTEIVWCKRGAPLSSAECWECCKQLACLCRDTIDQPRTQAKGQGNLGGGCPAPHAGPSSSTLSRRCALSIAVTPAERRAPGWGRLAIYLLPSQRLKWKNLFAEAQLWRAVGSRARCAKSQADACDCDFDFGFRI
jgi:hypothetical protein